MRERLGCEPVHAGGILIHRLERHADHITALLGLTFLLLAMMDVLAVVAREANLRHTAPAMAGGVRAKQMQPMSRLGVIEAE